MHAIWFSIFLPALIATVWIWEKLRSPKVWLSLSLIALVTTVLWVGSDLIRFAEVQGSYNNAGLRMFRLLLSEPDKPALQLIFGFSMAALFSMLLSNTADTTQVSQVNQVGETINVDTEQN